MIPIRIESGEKKAWDILSDLDAGDVQKKAAVTFDRSLKGFIIRSFGIDFYVSPSERKIGTQSGGGEILLDRLKDFFRLSLLWYLVGAKDIPETGRLIKPIDVRGGQRFFTGTHTLPLDEISKLYGNDPDGFIKKGLSLGGTPAGYGDASLKMFPLPRLPVHFILWREDDEFPARTDILFDSTCDMQIERSDIIWAVAMMSVLIML